MSDTPDLDFIYEDSDKYLAEIAGTYNDFEVICVYFMAQTVTESYRIHQNY